MEADVAATAETLDNVGADPCEEQQDENGRHAKDTIRQAAVGISTLNTEPGVKRVDLASLSPLAVAVDDGILETVNELGERNILVVIEDVDSLEGAVGAISELEPQELTGIWGRSTAELNSESRAEVGFTKDPSAIAVRDKMTGRNLRMAASSGCFFTTSVWWKNEMKGWKVVSMSMNWRGSSLKAIRWRALRTELKAVRLATIRRSASERYAEIKELHTVADAANVLITEDGILTQVSETASLLEESGRETMSVGLVVNELRGDVVIDLYHSITFSSF